MMRFLLRAGRVFAAYKTADELLMRPIAPAPTQAPVSQPASADGHEANAIGHAPATGPDEQGAASDGVSHA